MGVLNTFLFYFAENFALPLFFDFFFGVLRLMSQRSSDDVTSFFYISYFSLFQIQSWTSRHVGEEFQTQKLSSD